MRDAPREFQTTVFPISDETILPAAKELVRRLKEQRYYTDTAGFDLRCQVGPTAGMRLLSALNAEGRLYAGLQSRFEGGERGEGTCQGDGT
jgi:hypothetical protein